MQYNIDGLFPDEDKKPVEYNVDNLFPEEEPVELRKPIDPSMPDYARPYTSPSEFGEGVADTAEAVLRGATSAVVGLGGDLEGMVAWALGSEDYDSLLPTSEDVSSFINDTFGEQKAEVLGEEGKQAAEFIGTMTGFGSIPAKTVSKVVKGKQAAKAAKAQEAINALKNPELKYNAELATLKVNEFNQVVPDKTAVELVSKGTPQSLTSLVTKPSKETKKVMGRMAKDMVQQSKNTVSNASRTPLSHIGGDIVKRLNTLKGRRISLNENLKDVVKGELSQVRIPLQEVKDSLIMGISNAFDLKPKFKDGVLGLPDMSKLDVKTKKSFAEVYNLLNRQSKAADKALTGADAHRLKKILDDLIDGKGTKEGQKAVVEKVVGGLRRDINEKLRNVSDSYATINDELAVILETEKPFKKFSKTKNWDNANLNEVIGTSLRNLSNDTPAMREFDNGLIALDKVATGINGKFSTELHPMFMFHKELKNFLSGSDTVAKSVGGMDYVKGLGDLGASLSVTNTFGAVHDVKRMVGMGMNAKKAKNLVKERQKAINQIVYELNK